MPGEPLENGVGIRAGHEPLVRASLPPAHPFRAHNAPLGITLASPREAARRGSQVALKFNGGYPVMQALIAEKVIGDFRPPDILRFGFAPLYISFADTCRAAEILHGILADGRWREDRFQTRQAVT